MLSNLTTGGWVIFSLAALFDLRAIVQIVWIGILLGSKRPLRTKDGTVSVDLLLPVIFTVWLLYLLS